MKGLNLGRYVLSSGVVTVFLAGCGGIQTVGAVPQNVMTTSVTTPVGVRQPSGSYGDLLYVTTPTTTVLVSYPQGQVIGTISGVSGLGGVCSDPNTGNVFAPQGATVLEYAHGGTTPIATLNGPAGYTDLQGCSVDPNTGNLAMSSYFGPKGHSGLIIFPGGQGQPTVYTDKILHLFGYTAYDNAGNLFVTAFTNKGNYRIGELPAGQSKLVHIRVSPRSAEVGKIEWDGEYLAGNSTNERGQDSTIYRLRINGTKATVAGTVHLTSAGQSGFWIYDGLLFEAYGKVLHKKNMAIAAWSYPQGGKATSKFYGIVQGKHPTIYDVTMSVAPTHSRIPK